ALQYVPFAALPLPTRNAEFGLRSERPISYQSAIRNPQSAIPLIVNHEVVNLPSASVLAILRRDFAGRRPAEKSLAILADPVFSPEDPRLREARRGAPAERVAPAPALLSMSAALRSGSDVGVSSFTRLPFSRQEADDIAALVASEKKLRATDFAASRATAQSPELGRYRVLHFATHGLINSRHPELSGLVFSLVDETGRPQDGFLRLHEIYNLKLGADLVVLSACRTALGKEIRGEGLIGLTRGFMYAGSPRVVASLWRVNDRATAELMKRFYQGMLRENLRPAAALRAAQVSMSRDRRWAAPQYWAAFTIQGEWN
ncbi:MAG: CHAT domain-containing protein, partial [Pyrinomonadaceae bacterium]